MVNEVLVDSRTEPLLWGIGLPFARMDILGYSDLMIKWPVAKQQTIVNLFSITLHFVEKYGHLQPPLCQFWGDELFIYPHTRHSEELKLRSIVHFLSALMHDSFVSYGNRIVSLHEGLSPDQYADQYIPLRGALSFGDLFVKKNHQYPELPISTDYTITLGNSVIKAHKWERAQKWIGVSIDPESFRKLEGTAPQIIDDLEKENYLIEWEIPTETCFIKSLAINFVREGEESFREIIIAMENSMEVPEIKKKYSATRSFIEHVLKTPRVLPKVRR